jgi:hypothetical protein
MRRRRLVVVACLAVIALAAASRLSLDRLSAEERAFVGVWQFAPYGVPARGDAIFLVGDRGFWPHTIVLAADRTYRVRGEGQEPDPAPRRWSVRGGRLVVDHEPSPLRRLLRPLATRVGLAVGPAYDSAVELAGNALGIIDGCPPAIPYTRAPAD